MSQSETEMDIRLTEHTGSYCQDTDSVPRTTTCDTQDIRIDPSSETHSSIEVRHPRRPTLESVVCFQPAGPSGGSNQSSPLRISIRARSLSTWRTTSRLPVGRGLCIFQLKYIIDNRNCFPFKRCRGVRRSMFFRPATWFFICLLWDFVVFFDPQRHAHPWRIFSIRGAGEFCPFRPFFVIFAERG